MAKPEWPTGTAISTLAEPALPMRAEESFAASHACEEPAKEASMTESDSAARILTALANMADPPFAGMTEAVAQSGDQSNCGLALCTYRLKEEF
jgi:hypothetical protein